jgi:hypothetical protein
MPVTASERPKSAARFEMSYATLIGIVLARFVYSKY